MDDRKSSLPAKCLRFICALAMLVAVFVAGGDSSHAAEDEAIRKNALPAGQAKIARPYTNKSYLLDLPFGAHSHWLQPWRAELETVPASRFINGIGIGLDLFDSENSDLILEMLARNGIKKVRIEIAWSNLDYTTERIDNDRIRSMLRACKKWGVRPLILLNANQGAPVPMLFFERRAKLAAAKGSRTLRLDDATGLIVGRSGLNDLTKYWAAEALITAISGDTITLSKPLRKAIAPGSLVRMATLKYRPFSKPGSRDYLQSIAGWKRYVRIVAAFTTSALGTASSADKGFDMEIWNELSFGSDFLSINNYYDKPIVTYEEDGIWTDLVKVTADYATANPRIFSGVTFVNGFANTIPLPAASQLPARIGALSKHPYPPRKSYPRDEQAGTRLDANGRETDFVPRYSALFPEYYGTGLQTETFMRDASALTTEIYGVRHGRNARRINGRVVPTDVWITETGFSPEEEGPVTTARALDLKAKAVARTYAFFLNKGVKNLFLYAAASGNRSFGIVLDNFLKYARTQKTYPANDAGYLSPALRVTGRITAVMKQGLDPKLISARQLQLVSVSDTHNHVQFQGDGTSARPSLYDRDVFAFLPYQVNSRRFVVPYYVMTRDITKDASPRKFTIQISRLNAVGASASVYDPISDRTLPVTVSSRSAHSLTLTLPATDYPYLLILQEPGS
jgi:hypothetical protein